MNPLLITLGGYTLAFGMVWLLLRHEYQMPPIASFSLGTAIVALGFGMAFAGHLLGAPSRSSPGPPVPSCS